jgi:SAM-dependent methyltransferase
MINTFSDRRGEILFFKDHFSWLLDTRCVLDIGCGTGNMADWFRNYIGITSNPQEVEVGKARGRDIRLCDAHDLSGLTDIGIDGFIMWDSLEHFVSPYTALKEIYKILPHGGKGLIFMPGQNWLDCKDHIHVMTVPQMNHLLNKVGFDRVVHEKTYEDKNIYCEGMAVYELVKDENKVFTFLHQG